MHFYSSAMNLNSYFGQRTTDRAFQLASVELDLRVSIIGIVGRRISL